MPVTEFQRRVLRLCRAHRNPNSYVAGGVAIHRAPSSLRSSNDIDFFHDTEEAVLLSAEADIDLLRREGFLVELVIRQPGFIRVVIRLGNDVLKLEWVRDTAFRFFPVVEDLDLGFRLHDVDLAINKCLALANRNEVRDILDIIQLNAETISLSHCIQAACGKDPGFSPQLLLDCVKRNSIIDAQKLAAEKLAKPVSPVELKREWLQILLETEQGLAAYPPRSLGSLFLSSQGDVLRDPLKTYSSNELDTLACHQGSIGGSWPRIVS